MSLKYEPSSEPLRISVKQLFSTGMANVTLELQAFTPLMVEGDYLIVEDSNLDGNPHPVYPGSARPPNVERERCVHC